MLIEQLATAIDCEGHIGINRMKHTYGHIQHSARIGLAMLHPAIPSALHNRFGGSLQLQHNPSGHGSLHRWSCVGNKQVGPILTSLLPYLQVKQEQAQNVLDFLAVYKRNNGGRTSTEEAAERDAYWLKAKALNRPAPATTKRKTPEMECDSLTLHASVS